MRPFPGGNQKRSVVRTLSTWQGVALEITDADCVTALELHLLELIGGSIIYNLALYYLPVKQVGSRRRVSQKRLVEPLPESLHAVTFTF